MQVTRVLVIEGLVNFVMALLKLVVGLLTQSTAIMADAAHSMTDIANNVLAYFAIRTAQKPADHDHPYGHQKYETLGVFILATSLAIVAFEIFWHAIERFGEPVEQSGVGLALLLGVIIANIALTIWEHHWARRLDSTILHADAKHTLSDVLTSLAAIVGWQMAARGWPWLDTLFAVMMSLVVFYFAFKLFKQAIPILVDATDLDAPAVRAAVLALPQVHSVRRFRSRTDGKQLTADIIISVNSQLSTGESHEIADSVELLLKTKFGIAETLVHIEPETAISAPK